jgi:hypothetical protein
MGAIFNLFGKGLMNRFTRLVLLIISVFVLVGGGGAIAQAAKQRVLLVDFETRAPISDAVMESSNLVKALRSDQNGVIEVPMSELDSVWVKIQRIGYKTTNAWITIQPPYEDQIIFLIKEEFEFTTVEITAAPKVVFGSDTMHVADFQFWGDDILLLTYEEEERWKKTSEAKMTIYRNCQLVLINAQNKILQIASLPGEFQCFYTKHPTSTFLIGRNDHYLVSMPHDQIQLQRIEAEDFKQIIEPLIAIHDDCQLYTNYNKEFPAFDYYLYHIADSLFQLLHHVEDESLMRMFRSEYKYLSPREKLDALRYEMDTGTDKEIVAAYMRGFQHTSYYEPLNAPMIAMDSALWLFDHHHDALMRYDWDGERLDSVSIHYHHVKKPLRWQAQIIADQEIQKVYTSYDRNGYTEVHEIMADGSHIKRMDLAYRYTDQLRILGGYAYYVYRPFESSQRRFLYKEKIRIGGQSAP